MQRVPEPRFRKGANLLGGLVLLLTAFLAVIAGSGASTAQEATFEPSWYMVVDRGNLMDENQEQSAINDAWRLNMMGTPFQVVTEMSATTPEGARQRAEELRSANGIESAPGAADGILLYAAVNPANRSQIVMVFSVSPNAVPRDGMTAEAIDNVFATIVEPQLADGHPARAIVYPIRELMYLRTFVPPPVEATTGWQESLRQPLNVVAPIMAAVGIVATWWTGRQRGLGWKRPVLTVIGLLGGAGLLFLLAVQTHSGIGVASALLLGVCAVVLGSRLDGRLASPPRLSRRLTATPRPPGTRIRIGGDR